MQFFIMAICLSPEAQKTAHAELDAVVGPNRLPDYSDRPHLPYVQAMLKEVIRWRPATPLGEHLDL